jgi:hypothetical protein
MAKKDDYEWTEEQLQILDIEETLADEARRREEELKRNYAIITYRPIRFKENDDFYCGIPRIFREN